MTNTIPSNSFPFGETNTPINIGIESFQSFLHALILSGAKYKTVKNFKRYVLSELNKGKDPYFEPTKNGLYVNGRFFDLYTNGLNGGFDSYADQAAAASGDPTLQAIAAIVDFDKVIGNFTSIFANGFDLSCWGASYGKAKAKKNISVDFPFMLKWSELDQGVTTTSLNKFSLIIDSYISDARNGTRRKFAKCTRSGHQFRLDKSLEFKKTVFDEIKKDPSVSITTLGTAKGKGSLRFPGYVSNKNFNLYVYPYTTYNVRVLKEKVQPNQGNVTTNVSANANNQDPVDLIPINPVASVNNDLTNKTPNVQTAGFGTLGFVALVVAGAALFMSSGEAAE